MRFASRVLKRLNWVLFWRRSILGFNFDQNEIVLKSRNLKKSPLKIQCSGFFSTHNALFFFCNIGCDAQWGGYKKFWWHVQYTFNNINSFIAPQINSCMVFDSIFIQNFMFFNNSWKLEAKALVRHSIA